MADLILTDEQKDIVSLDVPKGQVLKISAFAGTAKTTTLREFTKAHLLDRFLYLAYNTSVAQEGRDTFPANVECKTTHALAFHKFGYQYKHKLGNLKPFVLCDHLNVKHYGVGKYLIDVLIKYLASADEIISEKHLILNREKEEEEYFEDKDPKTIKFLLKKVNQLWEKMQDPDNKKIPMLHDGYLKLFQLSRPQLDYDYVLLDEAHDTNPVVLDIFLNQKASKILVGDSHQSCYGWRWSYDALKVDANIHKYLSKSFRFNHEIAGVANLILNKLKKEPKKLAGVGEHGKVGWVNKSESYTIVARTNAALFDEAVELLGQGKSFGWIGTNGKQNFNPFNHYYFNRILDVYRLYSNEKKRIVDKYIKRFKDFKHFEEVVNDEDAPDVELKSRAKVVKKHKEKIPLLVDSICHNSIDPKKADVCFTTAHRAKGLEWPQVQMTDDFCETIFVDKKTGKSRILTLDDIDEQELNLLYIGATRAKNTLQINKSILNLREYAHNN
jgi:F-box protein, helicase, 18